jgi:hypothetical protein
MLCFTAVQAQEAQDEVNIQPEDITEFFTAHHHEIPCVKIVFSVLVENEETYNQQNWNDLVTISHNATELLETTPTPSSVALLTPILHLLEQYREQDNQGLEAGLDIDLFNINLLDELESDCVQKIQLPETPSSVQHIFLENPACIAFAFTIQKSDLTSVQDWIAILEHTESFITHIKNQNNNIHIIDSLSDFLFILEDAQKENPTLSTKIEIIA